MPNVWGGTFSVTALPATPPPPPPPPSDSRGGRGDGAGGQSAWLSAKRAASMKISAAAAAAGAWPHRRSLGIITHDVTLGTLSPRPVEFLMGTSTRSYEDLRERRNVSRDRIFWGAPLWICRSLPLPALSCPGATGSVRDWGATTTDCRFVTRSVR